MQAQFVASRAMVAAGVLVIVAVAGSPVADWAWLALLPAAALFAVGIGTVAHGGRPQPALAVRVVGLVLSFAAVALVGLAISGLFVQQSLRMEPRWLTRAVSWTAWLFLVTAMVFGLAAGAARSLPRRWSLLLAVSLPLGLGFDAAVGGIPGMFLQGAGFYLGAGLLALSLVGVGMTRQRWHSSGPIRL